MKITRDLAFAGLRAPHPRAVPEPPIAGQVGPPPRTLGHPGPRRVKAARVCDLRFLVVAV